VPVPSPSAGFWGSAVYFFSSNLKLGMALMMFFISSADLSG